MARMAMVLRWWHFVRTPTIYPQRWQDRLFRGHVSWFGHHVVIYGANAMHWAINVRAFGTWWCAHPTTRTFGGHWPAYFYVSRDATPQHATVLLGRAD